LTLSNQSGSEGTPANKIMTGTGADLSVPSNTSVTMQYDATAALWRVTGSSNSANTLAAGTTGQVQFNGGTNLAADSNFFWDNTNKRLGIGTATPVEAFSLVSSTANGIMYLQNTWNSGYVAIDFYDSSNVKQAGIGWGNPSSSLANEFYFGTAGANPTALRTNNTERMRITSGGNVGIGTTTPTNILSLSGSASQTFWMERNPTANTAGNSLTVEASGAASGGTNLNGGNLTLSSGTSTGSGTSNILFQTANAGSSGTTDSSPATAMTIFGNGSVGIGTSLVNAAALQIGTDLSFAYGWPAIGFNISGWGEADRRIASMELEGEPAGNCGSGLSHVAADHPGITCGADRMLTFLLTRLVHFLAAIWHNLSPPLTIPVGTPAGAHTQDRHCSTPVPCDETGVVRGARPRPLYCGRPWRPAPRARLGR
jgi:hypothetical protein